MAIPFASPAINRGPPRADNPTGSCPTFWKACDVDIVGS